MFKYYYLLRPPGIGCQPDNSIEREYWQPVRDIPIPDTSRHAHGWVTYADKLDIEVVWKYDLLPDNELERLNYLLWLHADRDYKERDWLFDDYSSVGEAELKRLKERGDYVAGLVLGIIAAGGLTTE
jgi:hypothetical protein